MFILYHDSKEIARYENYFDMLATFRWKHPYSLDHGCKYEGYSWAEVSNDA